MIDDAGAIEELITQLVREAPRIDEAAAGELVERLHRMADVPLAVAVARVLELVRAGRVDPGIALPPLAMACATLAAGVRGTLTARELEAARYEIETLLPVPARPDVPVSALNRGSRRQT
jgi:hypothetical protein